VVRRAALPRDFFVPSGFRGYGLTCHQAQKLVTVAHMIAEHHQLDFLMPLQYFYAGKGEGMPVIEFVQPEEIPEPQRHLLVHASDMTPRLRAFHDSEIGLEVLTVDASETYIMRLVRLHRQSDALPVEIGAIGIDLSGFPLEIARQIREGLHPLGGILEKEAVPHQSAPKGYFRVVTDSNLAKILKTSEGQNLYGRCNALMHSDGMVFADIVEILPH
jgi:hypothetical protein